MNGDLNKQIKTDMNILFQSAHIKGIGTDLVEVKRIQKIWDRFGLAFARRILTINEFQEFQKTLLPVAFLAKRYAAKEAMAKAMGTGFQPNGFWLTDIGVLNDALGKPYLDFTQRMQGIIMERGIEQCYLSLSDEKEFALAFVVLVG